MGRNIAIIVGAGKGRRIGSKDKAFLDIDEKPIIFYSISQFEKSNLIDEIILVVGKNKINYAEKIVSEFKFKKVRNIVCGGKKRQDSVYNALKKIDNADLVLIHDAARPMADGKLIKSIVDSARKHGAAIPAIKPADTIKIGRENVKFTPKKEETLLVQTPQGFKYDILKKAYDHAIKNKIHGTDDAVLVERLGHKVSVIEGDSKNIKITIPSDLIVIKAFLGGKK